MSLPISDTSKVASSHATVATRHKGPLKDGKDLVGEMCFNLEPEELLSMCFVCIMNEEALGRPIVVNILVRHRQFFSFWRTARATAWTSRWHRQPSTNPCLEGSDPTHEPWPRADASDGSYSTSGDCQSAAVHAIVYLKTPREITGTCQ